MSKHFDAFVDILFELMNTEKRHTLASCAEYAEVSKSTAQRVLQTMAFHYPINTFHGGDAKGGISLDLKLTPNGKVLDNKRIDLIHKALDFFLTQCDEGETEMVKELIGDFTLKSKKGESDEQNQNYGLA
jgi:hypothetical protein